MHSAGFPVGAAKGSPSGSRYKYVANAQQVLQAVNFGMGVYFNTLHLLGSFINCRHEGLLFGFMGSYGKMTITE